MTTPSDPASLTLLALDTATENCSVALWHRQEMTEVAAESPREHSQKILHFIDNLLQERQVSRHMVNGVVVGVGPGSFTGVRIGVSVGQGLAYSLNLPVVGINSLLAMAEQARRTQQSNRVLSVIDARMGEVYLAAYNYQDDAWREVLAPQVMAPTSVTEALQELGLATEGWDLVGTGIVTYKDELAKLGRVLANVTLPLAQDMLTLARTQWPQDAIAAAELQPLYVRNEVTWKKLPGR